MSGKTLNKAEIKKQWNKRADDDSIDISHKFENFFWHGYEKEVAFKYLFPGAKVLDLGCGTGRLSIPLYEMGYDVTAIDYSEKAIKRLRKICPDLKSRVGDITRLNIREKFDIIILVRTLQSLPTRKMKKDAMIEIKSILAENGKIVIIEGNPERVYAEPPPYNYFLSYSGWKKLFKETDVKIIMKSSIPFLTLLSIVDGKFRYSIAKRTRWVYSLVALIDKSIGWIKPNLVSTEFSFAVVAD